MSDSSRRSRSPSQDDLDISTRATTPGLGWRSNVVIWGAVALLAAVVFYLDLAIWWLLVLVVLAGIVFLVGAFLWHMVVKRGAWTWMRQACRPGMLMALGKTAEAESAYASALARARRFAAADYRRGLMLCELAWFAKNQGRMQEALELYEESVAILQRNPAATPFEYFAAVNNHAICFIHLKDYLSAQRILEKAIDMTLAVRKDDRSVLGKLPLPQFQLIQLIMHLNLAFLLMEMRELPEAEAHLREADALAPLLSKRAMACWHDHYLVLCAMWELESGNLTLAEQELAETRNSEYPPVLRMRSRLHQARHEYAQAEQLLRKYQQAERKKGPLHRPEMLRASLDFAECLFGQGKHDEAFASLQEARAIAADFKLPPDDFWRSTLTTWRERARATNRPEIAAAIESEMARVPPPATTTGVTILDKIRVNRG